MRKTVMRRQRRASFIGDASTMSEMFQQFMIVKNGEGLASRTIKEYNLHFEYFKEYIGRELLADEMTTELFMGWINHMINEREFSPTTVNVRVRTMRAFLRYCYEDKMWITEPIHRRFKPIKTPIDVVEAFTVDEFRKIVDAIDDESYTGFRTKVIAHVLLDTMVRVGELVDIKRQNIDYKSMSIRLEAADTKTRVGRFVPISGRTAKLLYEYTEETVEFGNDYVFLTFEGEKMSEATVRDDLRFYGRVAKITNKRVSPHTFRHTGALFYIMGGGDPFSLQKILGHSHMNMVRRYVQMTNKDVQNQHSTYSPLNYVFKNSSKSP